MSVIRVPYDFGWMAALGKIRGSKTFNIFGYNPAVGVAAELIEPGGSATPYLPTAATTVEVLSSSANDTAAGTGARTVLVTGLDSAFREVSEIYTMNGVTPVIGTTSFIRVNNISVLTVGTYGGSNAGTITSRASGGGTTFRIISAARSQCQCALSTVPAGKTLVITDVHVVIQTAKDVTFFFYEREDADLVSAPFSPLSSSREYTGLALAVDFESNNSPKVLREKTDWYVSAAASATTAAVSINILGIMYDNEVWNL